MPRYRKKPVVIDAIQFTGANHAEVAKFMGIINYDRNSRGIPIATLEGELVAGPGDWLIRGIKGEYYPCRSDIFEATYEPAEPTDARPDR